MYRNYKITGDGTPKYDDSGYHLAPERRFTDSTNEWKKRLEGTRPKALRRRTPKSQQGTTFTLKVKHLVYAIIFFGLIAVFGRTNPPMISNINSTQLVDVTLNSAITDMGNQFIKPSTGNMFFHVDVTFENISTDIKNINMYDFTLVDKDGRNFKVVYTDTQNGSTTRDLTPNSKSTGKLTFEVPIGYTGELKLLFNNSDSHTNTISTFKIQ